jgi:hypothetical protein
MLQKIGIGALIVFICAVVIAGAVADEKEWEEYSSAHHCSVAGKQEGHMQTGISSSGKLVTTFEDDKTIYLCDGGEIRIQ